MARKPLGELLLDSQLLDKAQLRLALTHQRLHGRPLGHTVVQLGLVDEDTLMQVLAEQLHLPIAEPDRVPPEEAALCKLDAAFCQRHGCIPLRLDPRGDRLDIAFADPTVSELVDLIHVKTHCAVLPHLAAPSVIDQAIRQAYLGEARRGTGTGHARQHRPPTGPLAPDSSPGANEPRDPAPRARSTATKQWPAADAPVRRSMGRRVTGPTPLVAPEVALPAPAEAAEPAGPAMPPGRPAMRPDLIRAGAARKAAVAASVSGAATSIPLAPPRAPKAPAPNPDEGQKTLHELRGQVAKLTRETAKLTREASELRVLLERDEQVLQRLLGLLVDRGVCSREQLVARLYEEA